MSMTRVRWPLKLTLLVLAVTAIGPGNATARARASHTVTKARVLKPSVGGTVRLGDGAAIYVPAGVLIRKGRVSVSRLSSGRYRMHITSRWTGQVAVTLPKRSSRFVLMHQISGTYLPEGKPGQRTVIVSQLSVFSWVKDKVKAASCFITLSKEKFLVCLAEKLGNTVGKDVAKWIAEKLGNNCYASLAVDGVFGGTGGVAIGVFNDPACTGKAGEDPVVENQPVSPQPSPSPSPQPTPIPSHTPDPNPEQTWGETAGGTAHTWTDYTNAGGTQGPSINGNQTVQIACKIPGFQVSEEIHGGTASLRRRGATSSSSPLTPSTTTARPPARCTGRRSSTPTCGTADDRQRAWSGIRNRRLPHLGLSIHKTHRYVVRLVSSKVVLQLEREGAHADVRRTGPGARLKCEP